MFYPAFNLIYIFIAREMMKSITKYLIGKRLIGTVYDLIRFFDCSSIISFIYCSNGAVNDVLMDDETNIKEATN